MPLPVIAAAALKIAGTIAASKLASSAAGSGGSGGGDPGFIPMSAGQGNPVNYNSIELNSGAENNGSPLQMNPMNMRRKMLPQRRPWEIPGMNSGMNGGY